MFYMLTCLIFVIAVALNIISNISIGLTICISVISIFTLIIVEYLLHHKER